MAGCRRVLLTLAGIPKYDPRAMPQELTAEQAAARLDTADTLGMPLGPGQPPAFMRALGEREDWTDLRVYGALLAVGTELFSRPGVHYLSGFYGPLERALRDMGADIEFTPADFRRFGATARATVAARDDDRRDATRRRRLVFAVAARGRHDRRIAAARAPIPSGCSSSRFRTPTRGRSGLANVIAMRCTSMRSTSWCARPTRRWRCPEAKRRPLTSTRRSREHAVDFIPPGATLQTGIGSIPNQIATLLAEGDGSDYGLHSEMFTDGCMRLHRRGQGHQHPQRASTTA